mgnify:CR=1 FL=1
MAVDVLAVAAVILSVPPVPALPCRISFKTISKVSEQDGAFKTVQEIKLFCAPEIEIVEGSRLVITQNDKTNTYEKSGTPAMYTYHQEIILSLVEEWV